MCVSISNEDHVYSCRSTPMSIYNRILQTPCHNFKQKTTVVLVYTWTSHDARTGCHHTIYSRCNACNMTMVVTMVTTRCLNVWRG